MYKPLSTVFAFKKCVLLAENSMGLTNFYAKFLVIK